ncbi:hypothetical protein BY458DRAFT_194429 [Sporodiniella umbellata]|nr:hypothetical protein BY458DRAFT_194429 [Sporodiniella umbellata]
MSDDVLSKRLPSNIGTNADSAEEVSQKYEKIFQQYSRLKAQHAVLKKAIIKEQTISVSLQGTVKEKEKELRKLQEQLDLLSFLNDRLTKRIQAVKEFSQKTSHFSLLGGSAKKELEKSTQTLEEVNTRLGNTIYHNETLHKELVERKAEFRDNINDLLSQIDTLEGQLHNMVFYQPEAVCQGNYSIGANYEAEIEILRGILFLESHNNKETSDFSNNIDPSFGRLESQAETLLRSTEDRSVLPSSELVEKSKLSHKTWREELKRVHIELEAKSKEVKEFLDKKNKGNIDLFEIQMKQLRDDHEEKLRQLKDEHIKKNMYATSNHEHKLKEQLQLMENNTNKIQELKSLNGQLSAENTQLKQHIEQLSTKVDQQTQTTIIMDEKNVPLTEKSIYPEKESVCTGADVAKALTEREHLNETLEESQKKPPDDIGKEEIVSMMRVFYDQQIKDMTIKLETTGKRTLKYADMYRIVKKKLEKEEKSKHSKLIEIERLAKEANAIQDLLSATETNHQKQIETMTEYIASMQESNEKLQ